MSNRLITRACAGSVADGLSRLHRELDERGITVFATIDHAQAARDAGLQLADEVVVIFGNPAVGTTLMQADARSGIDLPLRILIWDNGHATMAAYEPPADLANRFTLVGAEPVLGKLTTLMDALIDAIGG